MKHRFPKKPQVNIEWHADEFAPRSKSPAWYLIFGIVSLALLIFAVWSRSILTIITFVLLIIITFYFANLKPRQIKYAVTSTGILVGNMLYPYKNIKFFWIVYNPPEVKTINFETTAYLNNTVSIELHDQDPVKIKLELRKYLPEDLDREENITESLARKLKF